MSVSEYKIGKKLYEDVIGAVYTFSSTETKKAGQIKILHEKLAKHDDLVQAFHKCAEKSCAIKNRNYISALSHDEGNGHHFLLLEACDLTPLSTLLKKMDFLSISDSIEVIETLAYTLWHAHIDEVIHAHLSPQSIFTDISFKQVKIANFGFDEFIRLLIKKKQGSLLNSLPYYSPELIHGDKPLNRQSDIYALGVLFYRLLVGTLPRENHDVDDYLRNPYQRALVPPSLQRLEVPDLLDELVLETLEPNVENRCPSISQFIEKIAETKKEVLPIVTSEAEIFNDEVLHETVTQSSETALNPSDYQKENSDHGQSYADTISLEEPGPETESSTPNQKIKTKTDESIGSIDQHIDKINLNDPPLPESEEKTEPGTELQNKTPEEEIDNEKEDETLEAQEEVSNQPGMNSNSLEKEPPPQFEKSQQTTLEAETKLAENKTSQLEESPETTSIPTERLEQKPVSESSQFSNKNEAKNPDLGFVQEKNKAGQTTKEESPETTQEANEKTAEPNDQNSIHPLATSTPEIETVEAPVSPRIESQEPIPDNNEKETESLLPQEEVPYQLRTDSNSLEKQTSPQLENPQEPPSEPTAEDTTSAASPEPTTILPEDPQQNSVSEGGHLSKGQSEIESQDIQFIQAKRDPNPTKLDESLETASFPVENLEPVSENSELSSIENRTENPDIRLIPAKSETKTSPIDGHNASTQKADEKITEADERNTDHSLITSEPKSETVETSVTPEAVPQENTQEQEQKVTEPLEAKKEEKSNEPDVNPNSLETESPQFEMPQEPLPETEIESAENKTIQLEELPETKVSPPESSEQKPVSKGAQLSNIESESQIQDVEPVPELDQVTNDKHNSSAQEVEEEFTKSEQLNRNDLPAATTQLPEEIDELASATRSELPEAHPDDREKTTESTQLDKPGEAHSSTVTTLDELQPGQPVKSSLEETSQQENVRSDDVRLPGSMINSSSMPPDTLEQNAQKELFPTVEENQEQNTVIEQRDIEQNEQELKPEEENLWPDQGNNVSESVLNQNQEDEVDRLVRSVDSRAPSSPLHAHENADQTKISQEPPQQTKVTPPLSSNDGQKIGMPFSSKDETVFSKSRPKTSIPLNFYKKQVHGRLSLNVIKIVLIALIPISAIYLLIAITFDFDLMNRLSSLKESFFIKKTESVNSSNSKPLASHEPAEANKTNNNENTNLQNESYSELGSGKPILQENNQIASTQPITSGKSAASFQENFPPVSELKLQLSVRGGRLPRASDIFVNGVHYGKTNNQGRMLLSNLTVNRSYVIKVEKQGFEMWAKEVSFSTLGTKDLNVALKPLPSKVQSNGGQESGQSTVTILLSNPQNVSSAIIYIDGKLWGGRDNIAPAKLQIPAGDHIVEVKKDGFRSHPTSQSITLANGENRTIYFYLIPN